MLAHHIFTSVTSSLYKCFLSFTHPQAAHLTNKFFNLMIVVCVPILQWCLVWNIRNIVCSFYITGKPKALEPCPLSLPKLLLHTPPGTIFMPVLSIFHLMDLLWIENWGPFWTLSFSFLCLQHFAHDLFHMEKFVP